LIAAFTKHGILHVGKFVSTPLQIKHMAFRKPKANQQISFSPTGKSMIHRLVILIPSFNNARWVVKNLESIFSQDYPHWRVIYIDDCSTDGTADIVAAYASQRGFSSQITLIKNMQRALAMENLYHGYHACDDDEIIVALDGDDWLCRSDALTIIAKLYNNPQVWLTYGSFQHVVQQDGHEIVTKRKPCQRIHKEIVTYHKFRHYGHFFSPGHPFSCYAWLFKEIQLKDLLYHGAYPPMGYDAACRFPLLEMAHNRFRFISTTLCHLNRMSGIHDSQTNSRLQRQCLMYFSTKDPYKSLLARPLPPMSPSPEQIGLLIFVSTPEVPHLASFIDQLDPRWYTQHPVTIISPQTINTQIVDHLRTKAACVSVFSCPCDNRSVELFDNQTLAYFVTLDAGNHTIAYQDLMRAIKFLEQAKAHSFYFGLTKHLFEDQIGAPLNLVENDIYAWQFAYSKQAAPVFVERFIQENNLPINLIISESQSCINNPLGILYRKDMLEAIGKQPEAFFTNKFFVDLWKAYPDEIGLCTLHDEND
jgi:hypothetical protein